MAEVQRHVYSVVMKFAVIGVDKAMRDTLRGQLIKLAEWPEFRPCTVEVYECLEMLAEPPSVQNNMLCVIMLDVTSFTSCTSVTSWLESLREEQCADRVCVVIYNAHKVSQHACNPDYIKNLRKQLPQITCLFHGPDEDKWQSLVSSVLRWGEIAFGLRGSVTMQYLQSVIRHTSSSAETSHHVLIKK